jgi:hypothetical protein
MFLLDVRNKSSTVVAMLCCTWIQPSLRLSNNELLGTERSILFSNSFLGTPVLKVNPGIQENKITIRIENTVVEKGTTIRR